MSQTARIALVTGANKGIGLEIARQLAEAGVSVLIGARDAGRGAAAAAELNSAGLRAEHVALDITDEGSIAAAAARIDEAHGRLDILVNNAGIFLNGDGAPSVATLDAIRRTFETNFFGTVAVTQAMLPLLRRAAAGRIVNVSSGLGSFWINSDPAAPYHDVRLLGYNASKAALNMFTVQLDAELRGTGIVVNSVCPGHVKTDLNGHNGMLTPEEGARTPVRVALSQSAEPAGRFVHATGEWAW